MATDLDMRLDGAPFLVELRITHFRYAIGGEHYYGSFEVQQKAEVVPGHNGGTAWRYTSGGAKHPHDGHSLRRTISAKEAVYLNKKDGNSLISPSWRLKRGSETTRFNDIPQLVDRAREVFLEMFEEADALVMESREERDVYDALAGPDDVMAFLSANRDYVSQRRFLTDAGFLTLSAKAPSRA